MEVGPWRLYPGDRPEGRQVGKRETWHFNAQPSMEVGPWRLYPGRGVTREEEKEEEDREKNVEGVGEEGGMGRKM